MIKLIIKIQTIVSRIDSDRKVEVAAVLHRDH